MDGRLGTFRQTPSAPSVGYCCQYRRACRPCVPRILSIKSSMRGNKPSLSHSSGSQSSMRTRTMDRSVPLTGAWRDEPVSHTWTWLGRFKRITAAYTRHCCLRVVSSMIHRPWLPVVLALALALVLCSSNDGMTLCPAASWGTKGKLGPARWTLKGGGTTSSSLEIGRAHV